MINMSMKFIIQLLLGLVAAFYFIYIMRRKIIGKIFLAMFVGAIGSVLGAYFLDKFFVMLCDNSLSINFIASFFGAFFILWIFSSLTPK